MEVNVGDYLSLRVCMRAYYSVGVNKHQPDELSSRYSIRDYTGKERPSLETIRASSPEEYCSSRARWRPQSSWRQEVYRSCTRPEAHEISPRDLNVEVRRRSEWSDPWYREQYHTFWNHKRMPLRQGVNVEEGDRKSTRLNSSHQIISYAVFCLKKKTCCATRKPICR